MTVSILLFTRLLLVLKVSKDEIVEKGYSECELMHHIYLPLCTCAKCHTICGDLGLHLQWSTCMLDLGLSFVYASQCLLWLCFHGMHAAAERARSWMQCLLILS